MTTRATSTIVFTVDQPVSRWWMLPAAVVLLGAVAAWALVRNVDGENSQSVRVVSARADNVRAAPSVIAQAMPNIAAPQSPPVIVPKPDFGTADPGRKRAPRSPSSSSTSSPSSTPVLSTLVAPGVHITPLSVPAGTEPMPAGPGPDDSEPEN